MKNKKVIIGLGAIAAVLFGVASSIAYLTDTESNVNVMTVGNVKIQQLEYERAVDKDGNWIVEDGMEVLQPYTQNQPIMPSVYKNDQKTMIWDQRDNETYYQTWEQIGAPGSNQLFDKSVKNVIDKFVFVKNTGRKDAYVRTIVAIEEPEGIYSSAIHINQHTKNNIEKKDIGYATIEGVRYYLIEYTYTTKLAPGEVSRPSFLQVYLDPKTSNEDVELFGSTFEVLAFSQAVQTDGFDSANEALDEAFGDTTISNNPWINGVNRASEWDGKTTDTTWYNDTDTEFTITTAEQLAGLAKLVNEGTSFDGKTITLESNIDLDKEEWTPIGNATNTFKGNFDGNGHTISNLKISNAQADDVGLFGKTTDGKKNTTIKNLTINNATVTGHKNVAAVAGNSFTADFDNINVTGLIRITAYRYAGAVTGYSYGTKSNITVDVKEGSFVKAYSIENGEADNSTVGGVIGYVAEGSSVLKNVTSNIDVIGTNSRVGGIAGLVQTGATLVNCTSSGNVRLNNPEKLFVGGIAGVWMNGKSTVTLESCTFTGYIYIDGEDKTSEIGNGGLVNLPYNDTGSGSLIIK